MNLVARLALVISLLGALATWLFLGPLAGFGLQIWAAFIMWGCFYHCGGGVSGFKAALAGGVWGAIMAAVALALIAKVGGGPVGAAICVGMTVAIFILGANISLLAVIPAAVYGYSAVAAELGGISRNSVIGKVHRLGLSGRAKNPSVSVRRGVIRSPSSDIDTARRNM